MATVILVRHGRTTANVSGTLAGRLPGVRLDEEGERQARATAERLAAVPLAAVVTSPLERCVQTAELLLGAQQVGEDETAGSAGSAGSAGRPSVLRPEERLTECDYGEWQGRAIKELGKEELWGTVQRQPSAAVFPGGESLAAMSARAVAAVRAIDAEVEEAHGPGAVWAAVSHGDVIKAVLADALGSHLDQFQRIVVDPASASLVRYTTGRPFVLGLNTHGGDLAWLAARGEGEVPAGDAVVGGGAGQAGASGPRP